MLKDFLEHETTSRGQWIEVTNTKTTKAPVRQSGALPWKPVPVGRFRRGEEICSE